MPDAQNLLKKLQEREAKLKEQIRHAKAEAAKQAAALEAERCRIVGAAVLAEMEENAKLRALVQPVIDARTTATKARKMLGLKPLPKTGPQSAPKSAE